MRRIALRLMLASAVALPTLALGIPAYAGGGGCHSTLVTDGTGATVEIKGSCFTPTVLHIAPNQEVTWVNGDDTTHTVTGASESFGNYNDLKLGNTVKYRFQAAGVYSYFCVYHPGMTGVVVVGDGTGKGAALGASVIVPAPKATPAAAAVPTASATTPGTAAPQLLVAGAAILGLGLGGGYLLAAVLRRRSA